MSRHGEPPASRRWADRSGFTLVEVLVAFAVMATILGVLYRGVVQTRVAANAFGARTQEEIVARSLLAEFGDRRDLRDGSYAGTRDGRRWTLKAVAMDLKAQLPKGLAKEEDARPSPGSVVPGGPAPSSEAPKPVWTAQRLTIQVATSGRPLRTEAVHLVKPPPPDPEAGR